MFKGKRSVIAIILVLVFLVATVGLAGRLQVWGVKELKQVSLPHLQISTED